MVDGRVVIRPSWWFLAPGREEVVETLTCTDRFLRRLTLYSAKIPGKNFLWKADNLIECGGMGWCWVFFTT